MQESTAPQTSPDLPSMPAAPQLSNRTALLIVFFVVFIDLLGFAIVLPLLPLIGDVYVKPLAHDQNQEGLIIGLLMASFSLMQFLFAPVWGRLSDRVGRRPILMIGLAGSVVFYSLLGYACQLPAESAWLAVGLLFLARIGAGISGATIGTAQAVIADSTAPEKRKHGMALIGMAFGIGFTFGPLFGFAILWSGSNPEWIGFFAAGLSLIALVFAFLRLPETRRFAGEPLARRDWNIAVLLTALRSASIGPIVLVFFLATLGFASFENTLAFFLNDAPFLKDENELAKQRADKAAGKPQITDIKDRVNARSLLFFAYVGFTLAMTQGLYRGIARRVSELTFMMLGIVFMAAGVGVLALVCHGTFEVEETALPLKTLLFAALTLAVVGFAFLTPSSQALISRRTAADRQGEILGINQSASALARILGPLVGIQLYKLTDSHMWPYLFGATLLALMLPMIPWIRRGGTEVADESASRAP
jgi:MFS transporter, DHA1 family, tetracycline resistance protein